MFIGVLSIASNCLQADFDADGVPNAADCAPQDPAAFGAPAEVTSLRVTGKAPTNISWTVQNIGSEVLTESATTKFVLSWDSRGKANGNYSLTATARDNAGHTTISDAISITIAN